jgi:hypothetical protein
LPTRIWMRFRQASLFHRSHDSKTSSRVGKGGLSALGTKKRGARAATAPAAFARPLQFGNCAVVRQMAVCLDHSRPGSAAGEDSINSMVSPAESTVRCRYVQLPAVRTGALRRAKFPETGMGVKSLGKSPSGASHGCRKNMLKVSRFKSTLGCDSCCPELIPPIRANRESWGIERFRRQPTCWRRGGTVTGYRIGLVEGTANDIWEVTKISPNGHEQRC